MTPSVLTDQWNIMFNSCQEEVEKYERKKQGRKRRPRKQHEDVEEPSWFSVHRNAILGSMVVVAMLAFIIYIALGE